ncbi:HTH-type transcriptional regulator GbpR [Roseobacter fucihabitans]|uniref:HTH-type transcriptional regulator GbpR n=1 Tax=Roseobacter fucihabitans TaxID=1537242 RepID=A0ABZ2BR88_9RHOB|nr:pca operon transcription factor PcaQ [Roseobacter litoralis]MBC6965377.1 HTH-type transcriptional regulator GbpR [Roseobacter litoralis]
MIDRRIKFRHIQCFVEIARERSLKAAAARLCLTQPAISKTLKELEEILGTRLMHRSRSGVHMTKQGDLFVHFAQMSLASLQQGLDGLEHQASAGQERLSIGLWPSVAAWFMPAVAVEFAGLAPDAVLSIIDGPHRFLIDGLRHGDLDLVIGQLGQPDTLQNISFTQLYHERVTCVVRPEHPALATPDVSQLENWRVVYPPKGAAIYPLVERMMIGFGIGHLRNRIEAVSADFGLAYTLQTDAIWITSRGVVGHHIAEGRLIELPFDTTITQGPVGLMTPPDQTASPLLQVFKIAVQNVLGRNLHHMEHP